MVSMVGRVRHVLILRAHLERRFKGDLFIDRSSEAPEGRSAVS